tara:strand:- start:33 stop:1787 length:1755 start_codon:yes stop_codon:yes gene_type:complete
MSTIKVNNLSGKGGATPNLPDGAVISGVATVTNLKPTNVNVSGAVTATTFDGSLKTTGTPTLGLGVTINASGVAISGVCTTGILSATTLYGDGSNLTGVGETIAPNFYDPGVYEEANIDTGIGITFNKKLTAGSGTATLKIVSAGVAGTTIQSWGISSATIHGTNIRLGSLVSNLQNDAVYQFDMPEGFVKDSSGTNYVGTAYTFDTSATVEQVYAWGDGGSGQLDNNIAYPVSSPIQIPGNWIGAALGDTGTANHTGGQFFAVKNDGTMWVWGSNNNGQLGQNSTTNYSSPIQVPGTTWSADSEKFAMGYTGVGAIKTDGTLWSWGYNNQGGLGQNQGGAGKDYSSPVQIGSDTTWSKISVGRQGMAAIKTDGTLWSWGYARYGMQGTNNLTQYSSPAQIPGTTWRTIFRCDTPGAQQIATKTDGTLWTWGDNQVGQLGINDTTRRSSPTQIPGTTWVSARTTGWVTIATKTDNTLWTWGNNGNGNLGHNNTTQYSSPVQIPGTWGTSINDIAQATYGSNPSNTAIRSNGTLWSWGYFAERGEGGHNSKTNYASPKQIGTDSDWVAVVGGRTGYAALKQDTTP